MDPVQIGEAIIAVQDHLRVSFAVGCEFVEDHRSLVTIVRGCSYPPLHVPIVLSGYRCHCPCMLQTKYDLDQFGLKSGSLTSGKNKWVVANLAVTQTYHTMEVTGCTHLTISSHIWRDG